MGALYSCRHWAASSRALETKWRPSGRRPDETMPMFRSTVAILLFAPALSSLLVTSFSSASTTPSLHLMPTAVPPFSTALTAYSTWKLRPSGEKTELDRS